MTPTVSNSTLSCLSLEDAILHNAITKTCNPPDKTFFLGVLGGVWVGFGGIAGLSVAGSIPATVRNDWPILPKFGIALFFPFAVHFVTLFGGELLGGNFVIIGVGLLNRVISPFRAFQNLFLVYLGNWAGALLVSYFFAYQTKLFADEPYISFLHTFTLSKIEGHGKIMALYFPVVIFSLSGFEFSIANMFFIPTGLMYGAPTTIGRLWVNQSAALLGNMVGGMLVIAGSEHAMNHWRSVLPAVLNNGFMKEEGTLAAHDVESTRRAKDFRGHQESEFHKEAMRKRMRDRTASIGEESDTEM
ncbi:hypothetical protein BD410DRAFT_815365 [Rickenella mellea]|uniref:Formate/nitrite transporter n=1 Tax=Rickenella mellea TaxID=50990 RepID=A0A4Y7Q1L2_9AGAM|nr:hypothetical protein BD410DRAFT_815365 [Rickenella mellea]